MIQVVNRLPTVAIESPDFRAGYIAGLTDTQELLRFDLRKPPTEEGIVEIIRNACEMFRDGDLTDELLRHDAGLVTGWVTRSVFQPS